MLSFKKGVISIIAVLIAVSAYAKKKIEMPEKPSYREVVTWFYHHHDFSETKTRGILEFVKSRKGWEIYTRQYTGVWKETNRRTIWANGEFIVQNVYNNLVEGTISPDSAACLSEQRISRSELTEWSYSVSPYFGYDAWYTEVIEDYDDYKYKQLSPELIYALRRAHSALALDIVCPTSEAKSIDVFKNGLSQEELKRAEYHFDKSIEAMQYLISNGSNFETFQGNVKVDYWNECLSAYHEFMFWDETIAKKYLLEDLYDEEMRSYASQVLNACGKNGFLFADTDNDVWPMIYVQQKLGIRKDVRIILKPFLSSYAYNRGIQKRYELNFLISAEELFDEEFTYRLVDTMSIEQSSYDFLHNLLPATDYPLPTIGTKVFFEELDIAVGIEYRYVVLQTFVAMNIIQEYGHIFPMHFIGSKPAFRFRLNENDYKYDGLISTINSDTVSTLINPYLDSAPTYRHIKNRLRDYVSVKLNQATSVKDSIAILKAYMEFNKVDSLNTISLENAQIMIRMDSAYAYNKLKSYADKLTERIKMWNELSTMEVYHLRWIEYSLNDGLFNALKESGPKFKELFKRFTQLSLTLNQKLYYPK